MEPAQTFEQKSFESAPFFLKDEGLNFNLVSAWELTGHTPTRNVDRYRFQRKDGEGILTVSVYANGNKDSFDAVVQTRYGSALIQKTEDFQINGLESKRVYSAFLDLGNTMDMIYKIKDKSFISFYGILSEKSKPADRIEILQQIDFMQRSVKK